MKQYYRLFIIVLRRSKEDDKNAKIMEEQRIKMRKSA